MSLWNIETKASPRSAGYKKTLEEKLQEKQAQIAARLKAIADKKATERRERDARLDRIIGAACRADKAFHDTIKAVLATGVTSPKDREFLKVEGWL